MKPSIIPKTPGILADTCQRSWRTAFLLPALLSLHPAAGFAQKETVRPPPTVDRKAVGDHPPTLVVQLGHREAVRCLAFTPDGKTLASAGDDYTGRLWDVESGRVRAVLPEHQGTVRSLAISPELKNERLLAITSLADLASFPAAITRPLSQAGDGISLLDALDVSVTATFTACPEVVAGQPEWITCTPAGYFDCSSNAVRCIAWELDGVMYPAEKFFARFHKPEQMRMALRGEIQRTPVATAQPNELATKSEPPASAPIEAPSVVALPGEPPENLQVRQILVQALQVLETGPLRGQPSGGGTDFLWISLATNQARAHDTAAANQTLRRAVLLADKAPEDYGKVVALMRLSEAQTKVGAATEASNTFQRAIQVCTGGPPRAWLPLRDVAEARLAAGDRAGALKVCALEIQRINALEGTGMPDVALRDIATIQARAGDAKGALALAQSMRDKEFQKQAFIMIARPQMDAGDFQGALAAVQFLRGGELVQSWSEIAHAQARKGDSRAAMQYLDALKSMQIPPGDLPATETREERLSAYRSMVLQAIALGEAERGDFQSALKTTARMPAQSNEGFPGGKSSALGQIAIAQAKVGRAKEAKQTLDTIDDKQGPYFAQVLSAVESESGNWAAALRSTRSLTNRMAQAYDFLRIAECQIKARDTNEARATLDQAFQAAVEIDTRIVDWRNLFLNKLNLLCGIARRQAAASDNSGADKTLRRALDFADIQESDFSPPVNRLLWKVGALQQISGLQAELGDVKGARQTLQTLQAASEKATRKNLPVAFPDPSILAVPFARAQARGGDVAGALASAQAEKDPQTKAQMLLAIAGAMLDRTAP